MGLTDRWVAIPADDDARRTFAEPDLDDRNWEPIVVPGHWRSTPAFADNDDPVLHRTRFEANPGDADRRWWLRFDGIFYQGDVWLDGAYLGDTEGYFFPHAFEVTDALRTRSEHTLAVEVACSPSRDRANKRNITGAFQDSVTGDRAGNPGGIWQPVHLVDSGPVHITRLTARCVEASAERAVVSFAAELDATDGVEASVRTTIGSIDHGADHTLAAGANTVEWSVAIDRPRLWWPHALGDSPLEAVTVEVRLPGRDDAVSDARHLTIGLREVTMKRWALAVNGERMFVKGAAIGPTQMALADATPADCARDIAWAKDAGLDLLRLRAHVARPETYAAADAAGLLLWQDLPLSQGYARQIRKQAVRQAREMVSLLAHHPSIALWCGHDDPQGTEVDAPVTATAPTAAKAFAAAQVPTWNRSVLDRAVKRALTQADDSRPVLAHSGVLPHLPQLGGADSHLSLGWRYGHAGELPAVAKAVPSQVRFPMLDGAQSVPESDDFVGADAWPALGWDRLAATHGAHVAILHHRVPVDGHTYSSWKAATQQYQADVLRHHIETLRRLKNRPTGGFVLATLADSHPAISGALLDHERQPKAAYAAVAAACQPVIVVSDRLPETVRIGDAIALDVHIVSDRRVALAGSVTATLAWTETDGTPGGHQWRFEGEVPADRCVRVGTVQFEVPPATGALTLTLSGQVGDDAVSNADRARIDV